MDTKTALDNLSAQEDPAQWLYENGYRGKMCGPTSCVVANYLGHAVGSKHAVYGSEIINLDTNEEHYASNPIRQVIRDFDRGNLMKLVIRD